MLLPAVASSMLLLDHLANLLRSAADHAPVHAASFGQVDNLGPFSLYISSRHSIIQVQLHACLEQDM